MESLTTWFDANIVWLAPLGVTLGGIALAFIKGAISKGLSGIGDKVVEGGTKATDEAKALQKATISQGINIRIDDLQIKKLAMRDDVEVCAEIDKQITRLTNDLNQL